MTQAKDRILLVDDAEATRYIMALALRDAGFEVFEATTGREALDSLGLLPQLVVLDVQLPDISGFEVCRQIKESPETLGVPILHVSACYTAAADKILGLELGADGYLIHPIEAPELIATVKALLRARRSEQRAALASRRWRRTFDAMSDCIFLLEKDGMITKTNAAALRLFGKDLCGLPLPDLLTDPGSQRLVEELIAEPNGPDRDIRMGDSRFLMRAEAYDRGNGDQEIVLSLIDISELRRSEEARKYAENRFYLLMENVRDHAIFMMDPNGMIIDWNTGAERLTGFAEKEILGKPFAVLFTEEDRAAGIAERELAIAVRDGQAEDYRWHTRKGGKRFWAEGFTTALRNESGELQGFAKVARDATQEKLAHEELKEREAYFRSLIDTAPVVMWLTDPSGSCTYISARWMQLTGQRREKTGGTGWLEAVHPDDRLHTEKVFFEANAAAMPFQIDYRLQLSDGEYRWFADSGMPRLDENGAFLGYIGTVIDIDDRKRAEAETEAAREKAEIASKSKSVFLANMSHEIRTPLGAILGFGELLRDTTLSTEEYRSYIDIINRNGRQLSQLIDDILDLSKVEAGHIAVERISFPLASLLSDVTSSLNIKAREKGIAFHVESEGQIPEIITSDPTRLRQILLNIFGNAIKFTRLGSVSVLVKLVKRDDSDPQLAFIVKDSGQGISDLERQKLFQPFSQADASTTRQFGGTGLGLVLSRRFARALGGDIVLEESTLGIGSTFIISIDVGPLGDPALLSDTVAESLEASSSSSLLGVRILIAEDEPDNQTLIKLCLSSVGAEIEFAGNGVEAVSKALTHDYDLILMDMQMPLLDGYSAARELRAKGFRKPIIALTAYAMQEEREKSLAAGCNDHLTKPINQKLLIYTLHRYCGRNPFLPKNPGSQRPSANQNGLVGL